MSQNNSQGQQQFNGPRRFVPRQRQYGNNQFRPRTDGYRNFANVPQEGQKFQPRSAPNSRPQNKANNNNNRNRPRNVNINTNNNQEIEIKPTDTK